MISPWGKRMRKGVLTGRKKSLGAHKSNSRRINKKELGKELRRGHKPKNTRERGRKSTAKG